MAVNKFTINQEPSTYSTNTKPFKIKPQELGLGDIERVCRWSCAIKLVNVPVSLSNTGINDAACIARALDKERR
jgi:hypothetical protein